MKHAYQKTGLYLAVQPILSNEILSTEALAARVEAMLPACPENRGYLSALIGTPHTEVRRQRLTALLCLLSLMEEVVPELLPSLRLYRDDKGRPYAQSTSEPSLSFDFNLTHTDTHAACALLLGYGKVGIDAEALIPAEKAKKISTRFFTPAEQTYLQTVTEDRFTHEATRLWTAKEALSKQDGRGFPLNFDGMATDPSLRLHHFTLTEADGERKLFLTLCAPADADVPTVVQLPEGSWLETYQA